MLGLGEAKTARKMHCRNAKGGEPDGENISWPSWPSWPLGCAVPLGTLGDAWLWCGVLGVMRVAKGQ